MQHQCSDGIVHDWMPRSENPKVCPRCKGSLDKPQTVKPAHPPCLDFIPMRKITKYKRKRPLTMNDCKQQIRYAFVEEKKKRSREKNKQTLAVFDNMISKNTSCKKIIESHKFILDGDPERLTTDFLVDITGCNCLRRR